MDSKKAMEPMTTSPKRTFIGWTRPILQQATERLFAEYASEGTWDLRKWLIVLPSSLAKRRLHELMAIQADTSDCVLYPPEIVTVGQLPEHLYVAKYPFASELVQVLAWCKALQDCDHRTIDSVLPLPPRNGFPEQWLELGKLLANVHRELASDQLDFEGVVAALGSHPEAARWRVLASVQRGYLNVLDSLELWDIQTARLVALQQSEAITDLRILMLSGVDLNQTQRGFLSAVAKSVHVWVAAPPEMAHRFDEFGCLISESWEEAVLELPDECLLVGNSPRDQFELTAACLAELGNDLHVRDVTLGVPDASLVPLLEQHLLSVGAKVRYGPGRPLKSSEPALFLELIGNFLEHRNYVDFACLIRHPVLERMINEALPEDSKINWLSEVDRYYRDVLPRTVESWINAKAPGAETYRRVTELVGKWLEPFNAKEPLNAKEQNGRGQDTKWKNANTRTLDQWAASFLDLMQRAYKDQTGDESEPHGEQLVWACRSVTEHIIQLRDIPETLTLSLTASEAIDWLMHSMTGALVPSAQDEHSIEMLGWLDLTLDDARALVLTGIHDGVVPECVNADTFLPNQLRRQLGMIDNARRYARDMYALTVMLNAREKLRMVVGRTNLAGDPLVPSRLLLACKLEALPSRVLRLTAEDGLDVLPEVLPIAASDQPASSMAIPEPNSARIPPHVTVTAFRTYLACPYRFYWKHVCGLKAIDDLDAELSAGQFGDLIHEALHRLHKDEVGKSADEDAIGAFLKTAVESVAIERYGATPAAAIRVQIAQAQERLEHFAKLQAQRVAEGWITKHSEVEVKLKVGDLLAGQPLPISLLGRIDRIDHHPVSGAWAIWDYKTSDGGTKPVQNHLNSNSGWIDLQLPLYRHLARALGIESEPEVGYILLPKSSKEIGFCTARFTDEQLTEADRESLRVLHCVAAGKYEPRTATELPYDDFARLCQVGTQQSAPPKPNRFVRDHRTIAPRMPDASTVCTANARLNSPNDLIERSSVAPPLIPMMIRASAGTGKTFQLSNRLLQILLSGQSVDHILATTFTRKAAGEILQRVLGRLATSCIDANAFSELKSALSTLPFDQADCLAALRRVTRELHRFRVSTLDSFYAQIARTFSLELRLAPGWSAIDPVRESSVRMQAIQRMLDQSDQRTLTSLVKMLAKGETKRSVAYEIEETVQGAYHFYRSTNAEAFNDLSVPTSPDESEYREALDFIQQYDPGHKSIKTAQENMLQCARVGDWEGVIQSGLMKAAVETQQYYKRELAPKLLDRLAVLRRKCASELLPIRRAQTTAAYELLDSFNSQYMALLRRQRMLAFADITYLLSRWMNPTGSTTPNAFAAIGIDPQQLMLRLDCGIDHLLLDEFQDTAPDQWQIIQPLAEPLTQWISSNQSFFCVGDTKQAIYGWRGGVAEIFDTVSSSIVNLQQAQLNDSYRSSQDVIDVVNRVFQFLPRHENFAECNEVAVDWSNHFPTHRTTRTGTPGYVLVKNGIICDADLPKEEKERAELEYSAEMIANLATQAPGCSVGVLFRENRKVAVMMELLRQRGVSASQEGGNPLTDSAAVQLILSLVHLADHPGDSIAAFHVQSSPYALLLPTEVLATSSALGHWFRNQVTRFGLGRAVSALANLLTGQISWWDRHRLTQLTTLAFQFETQFTHRLRDFELFVQQQRVALPSEAQVKVMTIHSSKGLEFDAVFLPDLGIPLAGHPPLMVARSSDPCSPPSGICRYMNEQVQTLLPEVWRNAFHDRKAQSVREILCVLYVAMTRARSALYMITGPRIARYPNATQQCESVIQSVLGDESLFKTAEAVLYEQGDPAWYGAFYKPDVVHSPAVAPVRIELETATQHAPRRGYRIVAPSAAGSNAHRTVVKLDKLFTMTDSLGSTRGTLIHACFRQIDWLDRYKSDAVALRSSIWNALNPEQLRHICIDKELISFMRLLQLESVRSGLSSQRYQGPFHGLVADEVQLENERRISLLLNDQLVDGSIDRLVILKREGRPFAAEIIDYKTDGWDSRMELGDWIKQRVEHHRPQLRVYAQVVSHMLKLPIERIDCTLLLLSGDACVRCDDHAPPAPHLKYKQLHLTW